MERVNAKSKTDEVKKAVENMNETLWNMGITADEAGEAVQKVGEALPPLTKDDIKLIKMNPSLSIIEKAQIIRIIKRQLRETN